MKRFRIRLSICLTLLVIFIFAGCSSKNLSLEELITFIPDEIA